MSKKIGDFTGSRMQLMGDTIVISFHFSTAYEAVTVFEDLADSFERGEVLEIAMGGKKMKETTNSQS